VRYRPGFRLLIGSFYADLVGQRKQKLLPLRIRNASDDNGGIKIIAWIEKLLQTPIDDYRKHARDLILIPYLVLDRGITDEEEVYDIVMEWVDKCGELRRLDPSRREFEKRVYSRIDQVKQDRIPHMKFDTLKEKNPRLYESLKLSGGD
jgi:hypothetical protein